MSARTEAGARFTRLRAAGLPLMLSAHSAWYLSGGVLGRKGDHAGRVPLSRVALKVPDCEAFLDDYRAAVVEQAKRVAYRAPVSLYPADDYEANYLTDTEPDGIDRAAEAEYRAHSSSVTGIYEAP